MSGNDDSGTLKKKIVDWLNTDEGKRALKDSTHRADEAVAHLRKSRQIDWRRLHIPFGPADGSGIWPHQRI